jgi:branched-chain amino acid transport system permease protein
VPRALWIFLVALLVALAAFPFAGDKFYIQFVTKVMIMALFAMSLDLLVGYAGLVSLGHALPFGLAAYALMLDEFNAGWRAGYLGEMKLE